MNASMMASIPILLLVTTAAHADLSISKKPTHDVDCANGTCTATAKSANLNTGNLTQMLAAGDTAVKTGGGALDIQVRDGVSWTSASRLTLDANRSVEVRKPVTVAAQGAVTIVYNDGGSNGDLLFSEKGRIDFWDVNSSLIVNGATYTLVNDIAGLASAVAANPSGAYALAANYDAQKDGVYSRAPIVRSFQGKFEGLGHVIDRLAIDDEIQHRRKLEYVALFKEADEGALIRDVGLINVSITSGFYALVGALVSQSNGVVKHCYSSGNVTATGTNAAAGGLVGDVGSRGTIARSYSEAAVGSSLAYGLFAGGLAGGASGTIVESHASGEVLGGDRSIVGGLVGSTSPGESDTVSLSYATGSVSGGTDSFVGGLIGANGGSLDRSFATGEATAGIDARVGGLIGFNVTSHITIDNVYATGAVSVGETSEGGGLIGENAASVSKTTATYSTGLVTASEKAIIGGLVGTDRQGRFALSFWDLDTSGISDPAHGAGHPKNVDGVLGLSDEQLKSGLPAGFDSKIWGQSPNINNGYPYLLHNSPQ